MAPATNDDGITTDEIDTAFRVLEMVRESLAEDGMRSEASTINEAHYLVQQYDEGSNWHGPNSLAALFAPNTPDSDDGNDYDLPLEGDVMYDPLTGAEVTITEVTHTPAERSYVEDETGKKSVAFLNPEYPDDSPVVKATYRDGDKEYKFPVTRLEKP